MDISLKVLADSHYNKIEEESQDFNNEPNARDKAWANIKPFLEKIYTTHVKSFPRRKTNQCPNEFL